MKGSGKHSGMWDWCTMCGTTERDHPHGGSAHLFAPWLNLKRGGRHATESPNPAAV